MKSWLKTQHSKTDQGILSHYFIANRWGNNGNSERFFIFLGSKITADCDCSHEIKRHLLHGRKAVTNLDSILKSRDITLPTKIHLVKAMAFPVWVWELDHKESWVLKNRCFWTVVLEKTLESPLDCKEIKPVNPKENQSWIFIGGTDAELKFQWPPDVKNWLIGEDPDAGKDWRQEKRMTEGEMVEWHLRLNGHEFEQAPGVSNGQVSLVWYSPWGRKESDTTEQLNWRDIYVCMLSCYSHVWLFVTLWTVAYQASLSMEFSRKEYWSGLPCLLLHPLHWQVGSLPLAPPGKHMCVYIYIYIYIYI